MISEQEKTEKLWKFLRAYEELINEYGYKFDIVKRELRVVKLPSNYLEMPQHWIWMEKVIDRAAEGDIIVCGEK